jgi:putative peptidoglycan lipid II flippase
VSRPLIRAGTLSRSTILLNGMFLLRAATSVLSYILMARAFGTSIAMDAFWIAVTPTFLLANLIDASGVAAAVTFYSRLHDRNGRERETAVLGVLVGTLLAASAATIVALVWGDGLVTMLAPQLNPAAHDLAVGLLSVMSPTLALTPVIYISLGFLNARHRFFVSQAIAIIQPSVTIAALAVFRLQIQQLSVVFLSGYCLAFAAAVVALYRAGLVSFTRPSFAELPVFLSQFGLLLGAAVLVQGIWLRERALASALPTGAISALSYGLRIVTVAGGAIGAGFEQTLVPLIAARHVARDSEGVRRITRSALLATALASILPGIVLVAFADIVVRTLFAHGQFGAQSIALTATAVSGYFGVFVYCSLGRVLVPSTIGQRRALVSTVISLVAFLLYVLIAPYMRDSYGVAGLALAASAAFAVATVLYVVGSSARPALSASVQPVLSE